MCDACRCVRRCMQAAGHGRGVHSAVWHNGQVTRSFICSTAQDCQARGHAQRVAGKDPGRAGYLHGRHRVQFMLANAHGGQRHRQRGLAHLSGVHGGGSDGGWQRWRRWQQPVGRKPGGACMWRGQQGKARQGQMSAPFTVQATTAQKPRTSGKQPD